MLALLLLCFLPRASAQGVGLRAVDACYPENAATVGEPLAMHFLLAIGYTAARMSSLSLVAILPAPNTAIGKPSVRTRAHHT